MGKKGIMLLTALATLVMSQFSCPAQTPLSERVYLATDQDVYVSGDELFVSAFCLDMATGKFSPHSKVAYVEIYAEDGPVQTAKLALKGGRGGGVIRLHNTIPTGNYGIVAYTAQCFNETGYDFREGSKVLSIINPFTTERSKSGVEILPEEDYAALTAPARPDAGSLQVSAGGGVLTVTNPTEVAVSASIAIHLEDGIVSPSGATPAGFLAGATRGQAFRQVRETDYEGEVIRAQVHGFEGSLDMTGSTVSFSVPGRTSDFYQARVREDGTAHFYTRNIYGQADAVLEVDSGRGAGYAEIIQPFAGVRASGLPVLPLSSSLAEQIRGRSIAMQVRQASHADSLYVSLAGIDRHFARDSIVYRLDDYTRFPVMEELFIEFITPLRTRRHNGRRELVVSVEDTFKPATEALMPAMVLLDGVPVVDHERIFAYDPLLVEKVVIYPHTFNLGIRMYSGVVDFVTYKHDLAAFQFDANARIVSFQGVSEPVAAYLPDTLHGVPDLRRTAFWHPLVEIGPGETLTFEYYPPACEGDFVAVVEGFDATGAPQYLRRPVR